MTAALALVSLVSLGAFEGELELKLTTASGTGTVVLTLGAHGLRSDLDLPYLNKRLRSTLLLRDAEPDVALALDPAHHTYQRLDGSVAGAVRPQRSIEYRVERLGRERVLSFDCEHVRVTGAGGFSADYWIGESLVSEPIQRLVARAMKQPAPLEQALEAAGVRGIALMMEQHGPEAVRLELTAARAKPVPAAALEVPEGYRLAAGAIGPGATMEQVARFRELGPEQQRALSEKLRDNARR